MKALVSICLLLVCTATVAFGKINAPFTGNYEDLPEISSAAIVGAGFNAKTGQSGLMTVQTWTYQFNQTWQSPTSGTVYKVPDQLTLADQPSSSTKACLTVSYDFQAAFNLYVSQFSFSAGVTTGSFSLAVQYNHMLEKIYAMTQNNVNMYSYSTHVSNVYSLVLPPAYVLNPSHIFLLAVEGLPASYSAPSDLQRYQEFVTAYGTHYICLADLGGSVYANSFLSKSISNQYSLQEVTQQFSLEFSYMFFKFDTNGFSNRTQIQFANWFAENEVSASFWVGGNPATQSNTTVDAWLQSIPDIPGLLNTTLCPISELVSDTGKAATLDSYIKQYIAS